MRIPVLLYHSISDRPSQAIASFSITPATFDQHLELITQGGHQALTVSALGDMLSRNSPIPEASVVVTLDDGFADTLYVAAPKLQARRLPATVYITTGYLADGKLEPSVWAPGEMLHWAELRELEAAGLEVGAHSRTHAQLDIVPLSVATAEVRGSKELLEAFLGHRVRTFAYPHGYASRRLRREVRAAGFDSACGVRNAMSHPGDDLWCIARLTVRQNTKVEHVAAWLRGEGAPPAGPGEAVQTWAWRGLRRLGYLASPRGRQSGLGWRR